MVRKLTSNKIENGIMAMIDEEGDVYAIASGFWGKTINVLQLKTRWGDIDNVPNWDRHRNKLDKWSARLDLRPTELIDYVSGKGWGHPKFDSVMFVVWGKDETRMNANLQGARAASKYGALAFQRGTERSNDSISPKYIRYYQSIAEENRERYKKELTKLKAQRAAMSNNFSQIKVRLDRAFDRYTTLLTKILQNPSKYDGWDFGYLNDKFARAYQPDKYNITEKGLFQSIEIYIKYMIDASKGSVYNNKDIQATMQQVESRIIADLDQVETELTKLEKI
jgi:hypothetical protein